MLAPSAAPPRVNTKRLPLLPLPIRTRSSTYVVFRTTVDGGASEEVRALVLESPDALSFLRRPPSAMDVYGWPPRREPCTLHFTARPRSTPRPAAQIVICKGTAGESLASPLSESGHFPATVVEMISVAEESNTLDTVLVDIADDLERRTFRRLDLMVRLLEPVMLLVLAGIVLCVVIALLLPVIKMSSTL